MTRITQVTMRGFKRQDTVQQLSGRDIFIGPNGIGKSSRIQALGTALLGYVPGTPGKRPQDTYRMATGESMIVGVNTESFGFSRSFSRKVTRKRTGEQEVSVTQDLQVSPSRGEKTLAEYEARIAQEMGNFPVMLDFGQFLAMTDADRRKFFYGLAGINGDEWSKEKVSKHLQKELLTPDLLANNQDAHDAQMAMIRECLEEWRPGLDPEAGVQAMLEWTKAKQKHWNAEQKKSAGAVQKLAELKNQLEETDRNISGNKTELNRLQEEITTVSSEIARQDEVQNLLSKRAKRIEEIKTRMTDLKTVPEYDPTGQLLQIEELQAKITTFDVDAAIATTTEKLQTYQAELSQVDAEIIQIKESAATAKASADGLKKTIDQASTRGGICVISSKVACPKDFTPFVDWAKEQFEIHRTAYQAAEQSLAERKGRQTELNKCIQDLQSERDGVHSSARKVDQANEDIRSKVRAIESIMSKAMDADERRKQAIVQLSEELANLESESTGSVATSDVLIKQRDGLKVQIDALKAKIEEQEKAKTTIGNMKASMIDSSTSENNHAAAKYLAEELGPKGIQGKMLIGALNPIRDAVTANLQVMGFDNSFFFKTESTSGQEVFRFGWVDAQECEVDFDALSTGQQMIVLIALLVTILDRANPPLKVLAIDNVENLDRANFERVIAGLNQLADRLDNILIAGVIEAAEIEGWTVHDLGQTEKRAVAS